jgi:hypothetical protein
MDRAPIPERPYAGAVTKNRRDGRSPLAQRNDSTRSLGATRNLKTKAGKLLVGLGSLLLFTNLSLLAAGLPHFLANLGIEALGARAALALAVLKFLQAIAFHPDALLPLAYGILVLFIALAGILCGLMLLRRRRTVENA